MLRSWLTLPNVICSTVEGACPIPVGDWPDLDLVTIILFFSPLSLSPA